MSFSPTAACGKAICDLSHLHFMILSASTISSLVFPSYLPEQGLKVLTDQRQHPHSLFSAPSPHLEETAVWCSKMKGLQVTGQ